MVRRLLMFSLHTLGLLMLAVGLSAAQSTQGSFSITIAPALSITTTSLPGGEVNMPYSAQVTASGGVAPYTFTLLTVAPFGACGVGPFGPLPAGLTMSTTGAISGMPTAAGTFPVCVQVADSLGGVMMKRIGAVEPRHHGFFSAVRRKHAAFRDWFTRNHVDEVVEIGGLVTAVVTLRH